VSEDKEDFFGEKVIFGFPGAEIGRQEIDEIDDFPGKDDFVKFYVAHNGGSFIYDAWFYPENCNNVSKIGDSFITLGLFLKIPTDRDDLDYIGVSMENIKDRILENYDDFEDFVLFHIPFATDVTGNPFWIDIQSGDIKYTDFQESTNPDDAITVSFSFGNFCKRITANKNFSEADIAYLSKLKSLTE